ncbi:unnamed protein product [marine sediment metagenome]|uniref:Uncharacterized protein n=1 Tax=marine sediment metagenome TaxID=412755 RepID=X1NWI0_9ZZZZ
MRITNIHGDIKQGKLDGQAYQLKDGRQMRRGISKKGGVVSKTQNRQRVLFKRALEWRAGLSIENRKNMESIAYRDNIRNQDGVIYDWSMLAMRLALARPTIRCIEL